MCLREKLKVDDDYVMNLWGWTECNNNLDFFTHFHHPLYVFNELWANNIQKRRSVCWGQLATFLVLDLFVVMYTACGLCFCDGGSLCVSGRNTNDCAQSFVLYYSSYSSLSMESSRLCSSSPLRICYSFFSLPRHHNVLFHHHGAKQLKKIRAGWKESLLKGICNKE